MQSAKLNVTCSPMFYSSSAFNLLKVGHLHIQMCHSSSWSHIGFNQSKPIFLPSNKAATAHKKNYSTLSNSVKSLLWTFPTNSLNTLQVWPPFWGNPPICGITKRGSNLVYYVWWLRSTIPIVNSASSTAPNTPAILGSTINAPIRRPVFLRRHNIHWC